VIYGLDIETDTTTDGRNPYVSRVVAAALVSQDGNALVFRDQNEIDLLSNLASHTSGLTAQDVVCTWNGSGFDLPFISIRAEILGLNLGWDVWRSSRPAKYEPVGYDFSMRAKIGLASHMDIAPAYKEVASSLGCDWSLKPVCNALGFEPVSVDRERIHELSLEELDAYVASDSFYTALLGEFILRDTVVWLD
jgi:DNA polymerase elongation subunit (family B)